MIILDPGHIYQTQYQNPILLKFVKRSGGAVTYKKEWPGIQTQAVMRAIIEYLEFSRQDEISSKTYDLFQLGTSDLFKLTLKDITQIVDLFDILIDRSKYLNTIINCIETQDAWTWLEIARDELQDYINECLCFEIEDDTVIAKIAQCVRMALWCYEARAYRRKIVQVNRKRPKHNDTARLRTWRDHPADDVPFSEDDIEVRPIGEDGHIVLEKGVI